jgi:thermitase
MIGKWQLFYGALAGVLFNGLTLELRAEIVGVVPGRILVKLTADAPDDVLDQILGDDDDDGVEEIPGIGVKIISVPEQATDAVLRALQHNPRIEFAEQDHLLIPDLVPNDPYYSSEWHLPNVHADTAWNTTTGSSSIVIGIIDTGVDGTHPDLAGKLVAGWNFYDNNSNTSDVYGHGTAVAGTAGAAANNSIGIAGVAWGCKLMPIRVSDTSGLAYESTIAKAINWAADQGVRVCNLSFGAAQSSTIATAAQYLQSKGGVLCVSSGNESKVMTAADSPYMLVVGATDANDMIASWSNTGNNVDLCAPGVNIYTLVNGGSYGGWTGTSFSAPIVAGVAALALSVQPGLSGAQIYSVVKNSTDDLGPAGFDTAYGKGRVNAANAVTLALQTSPAPPPPPPPPGDTTPPSIVITSPANGGKLSTSATSVYVNVLDNVKVTKVSLYFDGTLITSSTTSPFTTKVTTKRVASGPHTLQTKAFDAAGNSALSPIVTAYR